MVTPICVLRRGGEYAAPHVWHLWEGLLRWWPQGPEPRLVVLTDATNERLPGEVRSLKRPSLFGWWSKVEMFAPEHFDLDKVLYFDLDTVIVGDLTDVVEHADRPRAMTLLADFYRPEAINSGLMALSTIARVNAWTDWREGAAMSGGWRGDGDWLDSLWRAEAYRWQDVVPGQVVSYKVHCKRTVPPEARVVCFHGRPRPWRVPALWDRT